MPVGLAAGCPKRKNCSKYFPSSMNRGKVIVLVSKVQPRVLILVLRMAGNRLAGSAFSNNTSVAGISEPLLSFRLMSTMS